MKHIKTAIDALNDDDGTIISGVKQRLPYEAPKLVILGVGLDTRGNKDRVATTEGTFFSMYSPTTHYDPS